MGVRDLAVGGFGGRVVDGIDRLNARHPWSHNDAFHPWILSRLPARCERAVDIGCGRGELAATLAQYFDSVIAVDSDAAMCEATLMRCAGLDGVQVSGGPLDSLSGEYDLVTMVAVLHHLDLDEGLAQVRRWVRPGGKFLCVGLARPRTAVDQLWDLASVVTNPLIGMVRHPWISPELPADDPFPTREPAHTFDEIRAAATRILPGAIVRRHLAFRHTIEWTSPDWRVGVGGSCGCGPSGLG